jgi:hypothetical protein
MKKEPIVMTAPSFSSLVCCIFEERSSDESIVKKKTKETRMSMVDVVTFL